MLTASAKSGETLNPKPFLQRSAGAVQLLKNPKPERQNLRLRKPELVTSKSFSSAECGGITVVIRSPSNPHAIP